MLTVFPCVVSVSCFPWVARSCSTPTTSRCTAPSVPATRDLRKYSTQVRVQLSFQPLQSGPSFLHQLLCLMCDEDFFKHFYATAMK